MPIRPRIRSNPEYYSLPEFRLENITRQNVRIDKLEIHYSNLSIQSRNIAELDEYISCITEEECLFRKTFRSHGLESRNAKTWILSVTPFTLRPTGTQGHIYPFSLKLTINYTRFYQNNLGRLQSQLETLFEPGRSLEYARRFCLDNRDNILVAENWLAAQDVQEHARTLLQQAERLLELSLVPPRGYDHEHIHRIASNRIIPLDFLEEVTAAPYLRWEDWILKHSEFYWDFQCEDSTSLVRQLEPKLREITAREYEKEFKINGKKKKRREPKRSWQENSYSLEFPLPNNASLVVYAKTTNRIRFEMRFYGSPQNYFHRQLKKWIGRHNATTIINTLGFLQEEATSTLQRIVRKIREPSARQDSVVIRLATLINSIYAATHDPDYPERGCVTAKVVEILSLLIANKRIVATQENTRILTTLEKRGVLERANYEKRAKAKRYRVASIYLSLFAQLQN